MVQVSAKFPKLVPLNLDLDQVGISTIMSRRLWKGLVFMLMKLLIQIKNQNSQLLIRVLLLGNMLKIVLMVVVILIMIPVTPVFLLSVVSVVWLLTP